ncbi:MAG: iron-sulfur cluster assembly scaffold protein [Anaerolineae bacterium]|nr:iron-sulfur cluster assembly scaffold protein [Anaerolineae bacterium]
MLSRQDYIDFLLDHYQNPRHHGKIENAEVVRPGGNPGCGDVITLYLKVDPETEKLSELTFEGEGCTISQASTSVLTEMVEGMTLTEIEDMGHDDLLDTLGRDVVMSRPRCAMLSLDTLKSAVREYRQQQRQAEAARGE